MRFVPMLALCASLLLAAGGSRAEVETPSAEEKPDVAITAIDEFIGKQKIEKTGAWKLALPKPPQVKFDSEKSYFWNLETNKGDVKVKLLPESAPMHVSSTIYLTRLGFYDDVAFHRVIQGFMAQGGDPLGRGTGGPGYKYDGEFDGKARHDKRGILSMANAGPGTDGSQFFITFKATPHLDGRHTVFGEVVDGMDALDAIEEAGSPGGSGRTAEKLFIRKATVSVE